MADRVEKTTITRPYELLVRFGTDGTVSGVSMKTITNVEGRDYESGPMPLVGTDDPDFVDFAEQFSAAAVAQRDSLLAERAQLLQAKAELEATIAARNATIAERDVTIAEMRGASSNPRHLAPFVFLALFRDEEVYAALTSTDPVVVVGLAKLQTIITYVDLDLELTVELVTYMESVNIIGPGRAAQILAGEPYE